MKKLISLFLMFIVLSHMLPGQTVYTTNTGKKYHTADCKYLSQSKNAIELSEAIKKGYTACKVCNPPTHVASKAEPAASKSSSKTNKPSATGGTRSGCVCRDGTTSTATGRGACSHHGGVDHWLYK